MHQASEDCRRFGGALLAEGAQVEWAVPEDWAEEGGTDKGEIEAAPVIALAGGVFGPGDVAAVVIAGLHAPMAAAQPHELGGGAFARPQTRGEQTGFVRGFSSLFLRGQAAQGEGLGRPGKTELLGADWGQPQLAVLGPAVAGLVGAKKGGRPSRACAAAFSTAGVLPLIWIR
jgi:hypothetical protein